MSLFYLHTATPTNNPASGESSTALPGGTAQDFNLAVASMDLTIGTSETSIGNDSAPSTAHYDSFFTTFSTEALEAQTIAAETWTVSLDVMEGNGAANSFMAISLYTFREGTGVIDFIYDSDTALGNEWNGASGRGRVATFAGAESIILEDDYLVLEVWRHTDGQSMATAYTHALYLDGTVAVTEGSSTSAASSLSVPQDITLVTETFFPTITLI